ncbi:hypothetical protein SAMN04487949_1893 [Halogranum gelatinilyticum]|uniref:Uncharacterized protein n=1 Tax=Halogranum gelatinilyticum TaxID=660521 RepID=A0A1G9TSU7_9EURY|nr:hypothetical protein [Halogranum gelatinilyticum]SDM50661.1 hypothetical protein SAMN04487949_1893 [Halogranum gelatinilyticum]
MKIQDIIDKFVYASFALALSTVCFYILSILILMLAPEGDEIQLFGIIIDATLTLGLLYLYWSSGQTQQEQADALSDQAAALSAQAESLSDQASFQEKQTSLLDSQSEIQRDQKEILSLNQKPNLVVDKLRPYSEPSSQFKLKISNIGTGPASNIRVKITPHTKSDDMILKPHTEDVTLDESELDWYQADDNYLHPKQSNIFIISPSVLVKKEYGHGNDRFSPWAFELISQKLHEVSGIGVYSFSIGLEYQGVDGSNYSTEVVQFIVPIKGRTSLETAIKMGATKAQIENSPNPPDIQVRHVQMDPDTAVREEEW